jgi:hypothetical protein
VSVGALRVPVFVESGQIECRGTPPALGDQVEWALLLIAANAPADPAADVVLDAVAGRLPLPVQWDPDSGRPDVEEFGSPWTDEDPPEFWEETGVLVDLVVDG